MAAEDAALYAAVYDELKRIAHGHLRANARGTLCTTELVHEAYLKLGHGPASGWDGRAHFFGAASREMREVLVDFARRRKAAKRGGAMQRVSLGEGEGNGERVCDSAVAHPLVLTLNGLVRLYDAEGKPAEAAKYRALLNDSVLTAASTGSSSQPHR